VTARAPKNSKIALKGKPGRWFKYWMGLDEDEAKKNIESGDKELEQLKERNNDLKLLTRPSQLTLSAQIPVSTRFFFHGGNKKHIVYPVGGIVGHDVVKTKGKSTLKLFCILGKTVMDFEVHFTFTLILYNGVCYHRQKSI
jgi:hypothetical protein